MSDASNDIPRNVMIATCITLFCATMAYVAHLAFHAREPCHDESFNPGSYYGHVACPDDRQTLSTPPGWTWIKCTCPEGR